MATWRPQHATDCPKWVQRGCNTRTVETAQDGLSSTSCRSPSSGTAVRGIASTKLLFDRRQEHGQYPATSMFGHGILTFHIPFLVRTHPGYNLLVRGPANMPRDGVSPLEGIVETDWAVATFTMSWQLTLSGHPGHLRGRRCGLHAGAPTTGRARPLPAGHPSHLRRSGPRVGAGGVAPQPVAGPGESSTVDRVRPATGALGGSGTTCIGWCSCFRDAAPFGDRPVLDLQPLGPP